MADTCKDNLILWSFTRNFFVTFLHEPDNRKIVYWSLKVHWGEWKGSEKGENLTELRLLEFFKRLISTCGGKISNISSVFEMDNHRWFARGYWFKVVMKNNKTKKQIKSCLRGLGYRLARVLYNTIDWASLYFLQATGVEAKLCAIFNNGRPQFDIGNLFAPSKQLSKRGKEVGEKGSWLKKFPALNCGLLWSTFFKDGA